MQRLFVLLAVCASQALAQIGPASPSAESSLAEARSLVAAHQLQQANELLSDLMRKIYRRFWSLARCKWRRD
jgi:multidrug efflux pump subunit AcrA (membrane-fusion protein)